jgi:carbon storage regulator
MLVLTRKKNESIVINDVIRVTVVDIRGDKVRLGIEAPRDIEVHRQEVYELIHGKLGAKNEEQEKEPSEPERSTESASSDPAPPRA